MSSPLVVAVDGPAGSGKSSVSRAAAAALGFEFLDTGAAYRALAYSLLRAGSDAEDQAAVVEHLPGFRYESATNPRERWVRVAGVDVTDAIRGPMVTATVSAVARVPAVRERLNALFRERIRGARSGVVVEGRDITTVVAPDAQLRVLLTASPEVRAARRAAELKVDDVAAVSKSIAERDAKDQAVNEFMTAAPGVTTLDSTELDFQQTVEALVRLAKQAVPA